MEAVKESAQAERERERNVIAVDQIVVDRGILPKPTDARKFALQHAELRAIVRETLAMIFKQKSERPLEFIAEEKLEIKPDERSRDWIRERREAAAVAMIHRIVFAAKHSEDS
jgi:hypothetical protein